MGASPTRLKFHGKHAPRALAEGSANTGHSCSRIRCGSSRLCCAYSVCSLARCDPPPSPCTPDVNHVLCCVVCCRGRGWLLSGAAFFGSCEEFPNDDTTAPRHREGTFCFSRLVFSPRAQRNPWVVGLGGMEREASAGGATPGSWNGGGRGGCKSHQSGVPW